jgi:hypothetical protein
MYISEFPSRSEVKTIRRESFKVFSGTQPVDITSKKSKTNKVGLGGIEVICMSTSILIDKIMSLLKSKHTLGLEYNPSK